MSPVEIRSGHTISPNWSFAAGVNWKLHAGPPGVVSVSYTHLKDAREAKFIRLGQLQDALLRNARFIVGIEMHRGKMSFDQAAELSLIHI